MKVIKLVSIAAALGLLSGTPAALAQGGGAGAGSGPKSESSGGKSDTSKDTIKSSKIGKGGLKSRKPRQH